jgi:hypothetical protein
MRIAWSIVFLAFLMPVVAFPQATQPFDVVIESGRIVDGTGNPWYLADIGIGDAKSPLRLTLRPECEKLANRCSPGDGRVSGILNLVVDFCG